MEETLDFDRASGDFFTRIGEHQRFVLATSRENRVSARMMSCVIFERKFCMQTDRYLLKYNHIAGNPRVALCADNIQIEGTAVFRGHPMEPCNERFAELFRRHYASSFGMYSHLEDEVLIEVSPSLITLWQYDNGLPLRLMIDCDKDTACRLFYRPETFCSGGERLV